MRVFGIVHPDADAQEVEQRLRTMRESLPPEADVLLEVRLPLTVDDPRRTWWGDSMLRLVMRAGAS